MADVKAIADAGISMGLTGIELKEWVNSMVEKQENQMKDQLDRDERAAEREIRKLELQANAIDKPEVCKQTKLKFKLPIFDEKKDDLDDYLYRFELQASLTLDKQLWSSQLIALLQGKALSFLREIPKEDVIDYDKLKELLLRRFAHTEENLRLKFRSIRPETSEDFTAFIGRMSNYFDRWTAVATANDFSSLKELLIKEQVYASCHKDLVVFLQERKPKTMSEVSTLAEQYKVAHPNKPLGKLPNQEIPIFAATSGYTNGSKPHYIQGKQNEYHSNNDRGRSMSRNRRNYPREQSRSKHGITCFYCHKIGHMAKDCYKKKQADATKGKEVSGVKIETVASFAPSPIKNEDCSICIDVIAGGHKIPRIVGSCQNQGTLKTAKGFVNGNLVTVLRDSGATVVGVHASLVSETDLTGKIIPCIQFTGSVEKLPVANIFIDTPYYTGTIEAVVGKFPAAELVIGNIPGISEVSERELTEWLDKRHIVSSVETRSMTKKVQKPLRNKAIPFNISAEELVKLQREDENLKSCFEQAEKGEVKDFKFATAEFYVENNILYRRYKKSGSSLTQVVLPTTLIKTVLRLSHDVPMAGHMGVARTKERVLSNFFWPSVVKDVKLYCKTCELCQKMTSKGRTPKAPLQKVPIVTEPFRKISIDLVGPLIPVTDNGNRYILTIIDNATRWPEAIPLRNITTTAVAEALFTVFSRLGIPQQILSDRGTQFTSELMKELYRLFGIQPIHTTPYHPQSNGMCERLNGTLKTLLKKVTAENPKDWDRYLPAVLFAYREVKHEATGFSPFEMLYGRVPRGPTDVLKELMTNNSNSPPDIPVMDYLTDLRERLSVSFNIANKSTALALEKTRNIKNKTTKLREFNPGDKVLLFLPSDKSKLLHTWRGPYEVCRKTSPVDYSININGSEKSFHLNMLQEFHERPSYLSSSCEDIFFSASASVITEECDSQDTGEPIIELMENSKVSDFEKIEINPDLDYTKQEQVRNLLIQYKDVITNKPGRTDVVKHKILLSTDIPVKSKPYPLPFTSKDIVEKEVKDMLELDVIEPSTSPYCSPIVLVKKPDGSIRFCIDFRKLNAITIQDSEPIPFQEELIASFTDSEWISKLDLTKGYWEIPLEEESKKFTAFQTPLGLFQFKVMPFGLSNAPATFARMMRIVMGSLPNVVSFFDDVAVHDSSWEDHLNHLRNVLIELRKYGLTAKPSKMYIGYKEITFLGHVVGKGRQRPDPEKLNTMLKLQPPKTKKQVRSLLGVLSYYRKFIANFAAIAEPLTSLVSAGCPDKVKWSDKCQQSLDSILLALSSNPILILPNLSREMILRTDACDKGIGACILQEQQGVLHPVVFVSRKLLPREQNYAIIEKECLAVVWAVQKLSRYLLCRSFKIQSDHKPLTFLANRRSTSSRLTRWALQLQQFNFTLEYIPGSQNVLADLLSRD